MNIKTTGTLKRVGVGLAVAALAAGAGAAVAASDDAGASAATDGAPPAAQSGQDHHPGRHEAHGGYGARGGYGHGWGDRRHPPMMAHRGFHGPRRAHGRAPALMMDLRLLAAIRRLSLTPAQRDQVRTVVFDAKQMAQRQRFQGAMRARQAARDDFAVLSNPGSPDYARAVQQLKSRAVEHVQQSIQLATDTGQKLYNVLTAEQKAQLPKVLADMAARRQQRLSMRMRPRHGAFGEHNEGAGARPNGVDAAGQPGAPQQ